MNAIFINYIKDPMAENNYSPIQIFCSPTLSRKDNTKPMCSYFDISFLDPSSLLTAPLHALVFNNYYVSSISCTQQISDGTEFVILDRKQLMPSPSSAEGSQQLYHILASDFNSRYQQVLPIRIYLFQPSPHWTSFDLKNVKAYSLNEPNMRNTATVCALFRDLGLLKEAISTKKRAAESVHVVSSSGNAAVSKAKLKRVKDSQPPSL